MDWIDFESVGFTCPAYGIDQAMQPFVRPPRDGEKLEALCNTGSLDDMAIPPVGLLPRIITPNMSEFRGFDILAIDHTRRWAPLLSHSFSRRHNQVVVDCSKNTVITPIVEIPANCLDRRKIVWNISHWQPVDAMYKMASNTSRRFVVRG